MKFGKMAEQQIQAAIRDGVFDDLENAGKPIKHISKRDPALSVGFGSMAREGVLPKELELKKQIAALRASLESVTDKADRSEAIKTLRDLELRYNIEHEARRKYIG